MSADVIRKYLKSFFLMCADKLNPDYRNVRGISEAHLDRELIDIKQDVQ